MITGAAGIALLATTLTLSGCTGAKVGAGASGAPSAKSCVDTSGDSIKIGFINSLSGTMAISEKPVQQALYLAEKQINAAGGVLGKTLSVVTSDGASDPNTFAQKADKLLTQDCVAAVFGGWTSASRKAMLPVFERDNGLLFYPVQYEGMESSKNIFYIGATTNQQIVPAMDYLAQQGKKKVFLVGSDYVFPRTANKIIDAYAKAKGIDIVGEEYAPLGSVDFTTIVSKLKASGADAVFNTLNGDSNVAFFKEYTNAGFTAKTVPVLSVSIAEQEVKGIGVQNIEGQLTAWNYYQTIGSPANDAFVSAFQKEYGQDAVVDDPMEDAYSSLFLWKAMVEKAKSFDVKAIQENSDGVSYDAPEGTMTVSGKNHHVTKTARIGVIEPSGLIDTVWQSPSAITPDPYLTGPDYPWAAGLATGASAAPSN
nr:urea ABC transporter substrate-binding protein [Galbitalea soli]